MLFGVRSDFSDVRYSATCNYMNLYRGDLIAFAWSRAEEKIDFICQNNILFLIWFFQHNNLTGEIKTCQTLELGFTPYLFDGNPTQQFTDSYLLLFGVLSCFYLLDVLSCFYWMHFCAFIGCIIVLCRCNIVLCRCIVMLLSGVLISPTIQQSIGIWAQCFVELYHLPLLIC